MTWQLHTYILPELLPHNPCCLHKPQSSGHHRHLTLNQFHCSHTVSPRISKLWMWSRLRTMAFTSNSGGASGIRRNKTCKHKEKFISYENTPVVRKDRSRCRSLMRRWPPRASGARRRRSCSGRRRRRRRAWFQLRHVKLLRNPVPGFSCKCETDMHIFWFRPGSLASIR